MQLQVNGTEYTFFSQILRENFIQNYKTNPEYDRRTFYFINTDIEPQVPVNLGKFSGTGSVPERDVIATDYIEYVDKTDGNVNVLKFSSPDGEKMVSMSSPYLFYTMDSTGEGGRRRRRKTNRKKSKRRKTKRRKSNRRR